MVLRLRFVAFFVLLTAVIFSACDGQQGEIGLINPEPSPTAVIPPGSQTPTTTPTTTTTTTPTDATPPQFTGLGGVAVVDAQHVDLSWPLASDDVTPNEKIVYCIYVDVKPIDFTKGCIETTNTSVYSVVTQPSTEYYFAVRARDESGNADGNTVVKIVKTPPLLPAEDKVPPTLGQNFNAFPVSSSSIGLSWDKATDKITSDDNIKYALSIKQLNGSYSLLGTFNNNTQPLPGETSHIVTGLNAQTQYCFKYIAYDLAGNPSIQSAEKCASTPSDATPPVADTPPSFNGLEAAVVKGANSIKLIWSKATDDKTPQDELSYMMYLCNNNNVAACLTTPPTKCAAPVVEPSGKLSCELSVFDPNTIYYLLVKAVNQYGNVDVNEVMRSAQTTKESKNLYIANHFAANSGLNSYVIYTTAVQAHDQIAQLSFEGNINNIPMVSNNLSGTQDMVLRYISGVPFVYALHKDGKISYYSIKSGSGGLELKGKPLANACEEPLGMTFLEDKVRWLVLCRGDEPKIQHFSVKNTGEVSSDSIEVKLNDLFGAGKKYLKLLPVLEKMSDKTFILMEDGLAVYDALQKKNVASAQLNPQAPLVDIVQDSNHIYVLDNAGKVYTVNYNSANNALTSSYLAQLYMSEGDTAVSLSFNPLTDENNRSYAYMLTKSKIIPIIYDRLNGKFEGAIQMVVNTDDIDYLTVNPEGSTLYVSGSKTIYVYSTGKDGKLVLPAIQAVAFVPPALTWKSLIYAK